MHMKIFRVNLVIRLERHIRNLTKIFKFYISFGDTESKKESEKFREKSRKEAGKQENERKKGREGRRKGRKIKRERKEGVLRLSRNRFCVFSYSIGSKNFTTYTEIEHEIC